MVLWFNAGNVPIIPFLQHSITSFGPEIKNIGAAITGRERFLKILVFVISKFYKLNIMNFLYHVILNKL